MDVRTAECRNPDDTKAILNELEQGVACNTLVLGLLREALIAQARLALGRLPAAERGTSALTNNLGRLLMDMGKLEEARPLLEEVMQTSKETLGDRHPRTLSYIGNMADLLRATGFLAEAELILGSTKAIPRRRVQSFTGGLGQRPRDHSQDHCHCSAAAALQHAQPGAGAAAGK